MSAEGKRLLCLEWSQGTSRWIKVKRATRTSLGSGRRLAQASLPIYWVTMPPKGWARHFCLQMPLSLHFLECSEYCKVGTFAQRRKPGLGLHQGRQQSQHLNPGLLSPRLRPCCGVSLRPGRPGIKVLILLAARALRAVSLFFLQGEHFICFIIFCPQNIKCPLLHFTQRTAKPR